MGFKEYYRIKYDIFQVNGERPFKDIDWSKYKWAENIEKVYSCIMKDLVPPEDYIKRMEIKDKQ